MNSDKYHLILSSNDENKKIELNGEVINHTQVQKLLGVDIDYKLKFDLLHIRIIIHHIFLIKTLKYFSVVSFRYVH